MHLSVFPILLPYTVWDVFSTESAILWGFKPQNPTSGLGFSPIRIETAPYTPWSTSNAASPSGNTIAAHYTKIMQDSQCISCFFNWRESADGDGLSERKMLRKDGLRERVIREACRTY